jgi:hypothetical protein
VPGGFCIGVYSCLPGVERWPRLSTLQAQYLPRPNNFIVRNYIMNKFTRAVNVSGEASRLSIGPYVVPGAMSGNDKEGTAFEEPETSFEETSSRVILTETADLCASSNPSSEASPASTPEQAGRTGTHLVDTTVSTPRAGVQDTDGQEGQLDVLMDTLPGTPYSDGAPARLHLSRFPPKHHSFVRNNCWG